MKKVLFILFSLFSMFSWASDDLIYQSSKSLHKVFPVSNNPDFSINNKYGDVTITIGSSDSIVVDVTISSYSNKEEKLSDLLSMVEIDFQNGSDYVSVNTFWSDNTSKVIKGIKGLSMALGSNNRVEVNYNIKIPSNSEIDIKNKFGDISIPDVKKAKIELAHGNLHANWIGNLKELELQYGKVTARKIDEGEIEIKFSDLDIKKAGELKITGTSSEIEIDEVKRLNLSLKQGSVDIDEADELFFSTMFVEVDVEVLTGGITSTSRFGELNIDEVKGTARNVMLTATSTEIDLGIDTDFNANYNITISGGKSVYLPREGNKVSNQTNIGKEEMISGVLGEANKANSSLTITSKLGQVSISRNE